ncbi:MAG: FAD-binding protein [Deltaproteobacteria bacterium HGW-Deltaproteobacteria-15]|jgi:adenylylsulfate reductase subunit A|nr:MAG: FAD-binding protein [Deltaproteobacteria bacterium HGW-Deltaproteobacteria-15]
MKREIKRITTDVAIIGGGTAGLNTAMAAAESGLKVLVADKARIERSGAIAGGIDHFHAFLDEGEPWDTREGYLSWVTKTSKGASNLKIVEKIYCDEVKAAIERVERIGIALRDPQSGKFIRTQALGQPGPMAINFNGKKLKPKMAKEVRRLGCQVLDRLQVTKLLVHKGEFAGFLGFDMRSGEFYEIRAKAAVIATGGTNRMFKTQTRTPFNIWYCPACTGDLHRAAFDAGVELANMEYIRMTIVPKGFSAPGFNAFLGMDSHLVNSLGERFVNKYHPMGEKAPRSFIVWATYREVKEGRGPIYMDCRHLTRKDREALFTTLGYDKDTLPDFLVRKGYNLEGTMIEMTISEPMQARASEVSGSGIKIDENCASSLPGLFGAGDSSDQMGCLHGCVAGGYAAGKSAARFAQAARELKPVDPKEVAEEMARVYAPLEKKSGVGYQEFEDVVRTIATDHFGPVKTEISLKSALEKLGKLDGVHQEMEAKNLHELMRAHEAMNIQQVAKISASAALERKESRFLPYHYRSDFPEIDDKNYCGLIVVRKGDDGRVLTRFEPLTY